MIRPGQMKTAGALATAFLILAGGLVRGDDGSLVLADLLDQALARSPMVRESGAMAEMEQAKVGQARSLPDPVLTVGAMNVPVDTFALDEQPMTMVTVGVAQKIPYPGKRSQAGETMELSAKAARYNEDAVRQELAGQVRSAYYDLTYLDRALEVNRVNQELMRQTARVAEAMYASGMGAQQDPIRAQVALSGLMEEGMDLTRMREEMAAMINRLIYGEPGAPVGLTQPVTKLPPLPEREVLLNQLEERNPRLLAARASVERSRSAADLARLSPYPDFMVMVEYGMRADEVPPGSGMEMPDLVSAKVSVPIPLWKERKQDQEVREMEAGRVKAEEGVKDLESMLIAQLDSLLARGRGLSGQIQLVETGTLVQARHSLESARSAYRTGQADFMTLLDSQMALYMVELRLDRLRSDYLTALAGLDQLSGRPVEQIVEQARIEAGEGE